MTSKLCRSGAIHHRVWSTRRKYVRHRGRPQRHASGWLQCVCGSKIYEWCAAHLSDILCMCYTRIIRSEHLLSRKSRYVMTNEYLLAYCSACWLGSCVLYILFKLIVYHLFTYIYYPGALIQCTCMYVNHHWLLLFTPCSTRYYHFSSLLLSSRL